MFSHTDDYTKLVAVERRFSKINEIEIKSQQHYIGVIEISKTNPNIIPLFIKNKEGDLDIIPSNSLDIEIEEKGCKLVLLGQLPEMEDNKSREKDKNQEDEEE